MAAVVIYGLGSVTMSIARVVRDRRTRERGIVVTKGKVYREIDSLEALRSKRIQARGHGVVSRTRRTLPRVRRFTRS